MERTTTWANIGTDFTSETKTISGVPESMLFNVEKRPMGYLNNKGEFVVQKGTSTVVDEFGRSYGPVSDNYGIIRNDEALGVIEFIDGFQTKKYGSLTHSGMQFIIGSLGEMNILGDTFTPYLIFRNSFSGHYPLQMAICPLRIVCQNQLNLAFKETQNTVNIRHTKKAVERIEEAHRIMLSTSDYLRELNKRAEKYATMKLTSADLNYIASSLFPIKDDMTDRQKHTIEDKLACFIKAGQNDDLANFRGTAWGLIQQYADYLTHLPQKNTKTGEENKFIAVTFDPRMMAALVDLINQRVAA